MPPWLLDDLLITLQTSSSFQADTLWNNKTICQHIHFWFWPMPIQNHNCCNFKKRRWIFSSKSTDFSASRADTLVQENRVIFNILDVSVNLQSHSKNISHDIHCSSEFAIAEQRCIVPPNTLSSRHDQQCGFCQLLYLLSQHCCKICTLEFQFPRYSEGQIIE